MRRPRPLPLVLAAALTVLTACTDEPPAPAASAPPTLTRITAPSAAATTSGGSARPAPSTTLRLPPPPAGGFDPAVQVLIEGAPTLTAEVARRPDQRARGLMQRSSLAPDTGMVFLFPERVSVGFWMLGTLIPLSIAYVDGDRVVSTAEMRPCEEQDCPSYPPAGPYTFAVEAPAGFFPKWGVSAGSVVRLSGDTGPPE